MKKVLTIIPHALVYLLFCISCSLSPVSLAGNSVVHVISVGLNYEKSAVTTLYGAPHDASEIAACLYSIYSEKGLPVAVNLIVPDGGDGSAAGIEKLVRETVAGEEDLLVFYFSGHGSVDSKGFFLAADETEESPMYSRLYVESLIEAVKEKSCPSVLILDSCYSGSAEIGNTYTSTIEDALKNIFEETPTLKVALICSSEPEQVSYMSSLLNEDGQIEKHSLFTMRVLEVLGWVHSSSAQTEIKIDGEIKKVFGYQGRKVGKTSVRELYEACLTGWESERQRPLTNRTSVPVLLIP